MMFFHRKRASLPIAMPGEAIMKRDALVVRLLESPLNDAELIAKAEEKLRATATTLGEAFSSGAACVRLSHFFDPHFYLARNPDVGTAGLDPYVHFLSSGLMEERDPHPLVDLHHIRAQLEASRGFEHWDDAVLAQALRDPGIDPNPFFDTAYYLDCNPDVRESGLSPLQHFINFGAHEGRAPSAQFVAQWYIGNNEGVPGDLYAAFEHFVTTGSARGLVAMPGQQPAPPIEDAVGQEPLPAAPAMQQRVTEDLPLDAMEMRANDFQGTLDGVRDHTAYGWARSTVSPDAPVEVEIVEGTRVVGIGFANLYRPDLEQAGYEDGKHAFAIPLSRLLLDTREHTLTARVRSCGDARLIGSSTVRSQVVARLGFDIISGDVLAELAARAWPEDDASELYDQAMRVGLLLETDAWKAAHDALKPLIAKAPTTAFLNALQAEIWMGQGAPDQALMACAAAHTTDSATEAWIALDMGNAYRLSGRWDQASNEYQRGLALAPDHPALTQRMAEIYRHQRLIDIRTMLTQQQSGQALRALAPLLLDTPHDPDVCQLVVQAARERRGTVATDGDAFAGADAALDRLETVLEHIEAGQSGT